VAERMRRKRLAIAGGVAVLAALLAHGLTRTQFFDPIFGQAEERTMDWRQRSVASLPRDDAEIRLVFLDDVSMRASPVLSPYPRKVLADLIDVAAAMGARAIGLDVFLERRYPELDVIGFGDEALRAAMERAGNVILPAPLRQTESGWEALAPDPYFAEVAAGIGFAEIPTAFDVVSEATLFVRTTNRGLVPGFALATFAQARGVDVDSLMAAVDATGRLELPGLPEAYGGLRRGEDVYNMAILFAGPPSRPEREAVGADGERAGTGAEAGMGAFRAYSAEAIEALSDLVALSPDLVGDFFGFDGNVVMIGSGFHPEEKFRTPFYAETDEAGRIAGWMFGVEVHANALHNLLTGTFIRPLEAGRVLAFLLVLAGIVAYTTFRLGVGIGAATSGGLFLVVLVTAWLAYDTPVLLNIPIIAPGLALGFAFLGSTSYISVIEGREKRAIRGAFSKYLSPVVVDSLVADPSLLKLGGEKRHLSILFSDLAGFTSLSESVEPEVLVALLNEYLDDMADIVMSEGGTLDKYIGDAIMALYGAPVPRPDHATQACRTALRMQRRMAALNGRWSERGHRPMGMRIGVNTGWPVVGNIGGEKRFDYTALGDAVNLAARLEPACKTYGVGIMISEATRREAGDSIVVRELELLAVYGKDQPVSVFELVALAGEDLGERAELIGHFERGLEAYRGRDFELALQYFEAAAAVDPADGPTDLYLGRCRQFIMEPPPAEWDGVERRQVK
jgi:class 3 adenylate cyclase/CHASE2 domain-containing sensor protein